jgi:hypothetical protein
MGQFFDESDDLFRAECLIQSRLFVGRSAGAREVLRLDLFIAQAERLNDKARNNG